MSGSPTLKTTPLHDCHVEAGGRLVEFAGWEMPVRYASVLEEHRAVREQAGLFDVSHMGEIWVRGRGARSLLERLTPNHVGALSHGRAQYSALLTDRGTYIDDLLVYCFSQDEYLLVVNAVNTSRDVEWVRRQGSNDDILCEDASDATALLALQGPRAPEILGGLTPFELEGLRSYSFASATIAGVEGILSRTGYTGEDGFELYLPAEEAPHVWRTLLDAGSGLGLVPAGLGARDTLRLEAGLVLYGHEIDETVTPLEAGLGWVVKAQRKDFIGKEALERQRTAGLDRCLVGLELEGRRIARQGAPVFAGEERVGGVTSGSWSPTLERAIAMALVTCEQADSGKRLEVEIRGRRTIAHVVDLPFYRRAKRG